MYIEIFNIQIKNIEILSLIAVIAVIIVSTFLMWLAYVKLLTKQKETNKDCKIASILIEETYKRTRKFFDFFLEAPIFFILFFIILIIPIFFPFDIMIVMFLIITILYFYLFPYIFEAIREKSIVTLKKYLKIQKVDSVNSLNIFRDVWKIDDLDLQKRFSTRQIEVWEIFVEKINKLYSDDKIPLIRIYFDNFLEFIDKRSSYFFIKPFLLSKILEWHFEISKRKYNSVLDNQKKINYQNDCSGILESLNLFFLKIEKHSLKAKEISFFFKVFKKHIEEKKEEIILIDNKEEHYIKSLLGLFLKKFYTIMSIENIFLIEDRKKIWEKYFSKEWKITKENLEDEKNIIVNISFNVFLYWTQERIWEDKNKNLDQEIDIISKYLFPNVDSIMWDRILIFVLAPRTTKNKIKSAVERSWGFSFTKEKYLDYYKDISERDFWIMKNKKIEKTIGLTFFLFMKYFTKEKLQKYIQDLKNLKYKDSSKEANKRLEFLIIFKRMLKYLEPKKKVPKKIVYFEQKKAIVHKKTTVYKLKLTKRDLINVLVKYTNTKKEANKALNIILEEIQKGLQRGRVVMIKGFGTFNLVKKVAKKGRNPATGASIHIPARKSVKFKAAKDLKNSIK